MRYDTIRYDAIRYATLRYDTIRYDTLRDDTIRYESIIDRKKQMNLLIAVAEQIKQAIDATTGETPSFATGTFLLLPKYIKDDTRYNPRGPL